MNLHYVDLALAKIHLSTRVRFSDGRRVATNLTTN